MVFWVMGFLAVVGANNFSSALRSCASGADDDEKSRCGHDSICSSRSFCFIFHMASFRMLHCVHSLPGREPGHLRRHVFRGGEFGSFRQLHDAAPRPWVGFQGGV